MNNERNIFEVATREKYRFPFRGIISVEDLWDLSAENLDLIYKNLNAQLKQVKEESLLEKKTLQDKELELKVEIIKYIVKIKLEESEARIKSKANKDKKDKILKILASKQDEDLQNKSPEELQKMIDELND